jgi:hypothetical protein
MQPNQNHNHLLPLEKGLLGALRIYGIRLGIIVAIYAICLGIFFTFINRKVVIEEITKFSSLNTHDPVFLAKVLATFMAVSTTIYFTLIANKQKL